MKNRAFVIFAGVVVVAFIGFLVWVWPYRGILPNLVPPPSVPVSPAATSTGNTTGLPLKLPEGFSINVFAKDIPGARVIEQGYVSLTSAGKIVYLEDADHNGIAERVVEAATGLNKPHGLAMRQRGDQKLLYVAEAEELSIFDVGSDHKLSNKTKLVSLPGTGRHFTRTILRVEDTPYESGVYISIGSSCDVCHEEDARHATVQLWNGTALQEFAKGLRNAVFMTRAPDGKIWVTEMGRDFLGDELPPDEINIIEEGKNYGWPTCYGKNIHDTQFDKNVYIRNPCMEPFEMPSHIDLPAHSAPLGLAFVPQNAGWPKEYEGNLLVAYHGSWNRSEPTGYKIRRFVLDGAGNVVRDEDFVSGWLDERGVLGRPVDLKFGPDGALFVSDDRAGVIYRITPPR